MSYVKSGLAAAAVIASLGMALGTASTALADEATYEIKITNITQGILFTPFIAVSHEPGVGLFDLGQGASSELEQLAEGGATAPLAALLGANPKVKDIDTGGGLLLPGAHTTLSVATDDDARLISLAAMLLPTNDGFVALDGIRGPKKNNSSKEFFALGYDAGTEDNDELCMSIPGGGPCGGGEGYAAGGGEGFVHVHPGIHGIGDLMEADHDWRNPVALVKITRVPSP